MYTYLEEYILKLYRSIGISTPSQIDMNAIATLLNIEISYQNNVFRFDNEVVLRNNSLPEQWVDFGHELAHVLLHNGSQLNMLKSYMEYQERKANLFALHFCVPTFMLEKICFPNTKKEAVAMITNEFNVTSEFAVKRLELWINRCKGIEFQRKLSLIIAAQQMKHRTSGKG